MLITSLTYYTSLFSQATISEFMQFLGREAVPEHLLSNQDKDDLFLFNYGVRGSVGQCCGTDETDLVGPTGPTGEPGELGPCCPGAKGMPRPITRNADGTLIVVDDEGDPYVEAMVLAAFNSEDGAVLGNVDGEGNLTISDRKTSHTIPVDDLKGGTDGRH